MARGEQLARQWKIIQALSAARRGRTAGELAAEMGCHRRTVYRDLQALQEAGFPLYNENRDGASRWRLLDSAGETTPLPLSLPELMALYVSRGMMRQLDYDFLRAAWESLFAKIRATLPPETTAFLEQIERGLGIGGRRSRHLADIGGLFEALRRAVAERRWLEIRYYALSRRRESRRRVAPYKIWFHDGAFYLIAHCRLRGDVRLFALERIREFTVLDEHFEIPEGFSAEAFMGSSFGVFQGPPVKVRVRFEAGAAEVVRERLWHPSQVIVEGPDGSIVFEVEVAGTREIKFWILQWGAAAEVLAPERLRREVHQEAARMAARHAGLPAPGA